MDTQHSWTEIDVSTDPLPAKAFIGGYHEGIHPVYIGRANYEGEICVGKYIPSVHKVLFLPWGGKEQWYTGRAEIYVGTGIWTRAEGGNIPKDAMVAAWHTEKEKGGYIARIFVDKRHHIGKCWGDERKARIAEQGVDIVSADFEVLCPCDQSK